MLKIDSLDYFLPNKKITNEDIFKKNKKWKSKSILDKTGVKNRYYANENETALDMSVEACKKLINNNEIDIDKIDGLIFCTQSPDHIMPPNSSILHGILGLGENVFAFDTNLACSGFIYSLGLAKGLMSSSIAKNILLINADTYSKYININDRSTKLLFGDAASASFLIEGSSNEGIIDILCSSAGKHYKKFIVPSGGLRYPKSNKSSIPIIDKSGNIKTDEDIHMDGMGIFAFVNSKVPKQIKYILQKNELNIEDIDLFIFHQASKLAIDSLSKILKIDSKKVFMNLDKVGNTVSASIPIALKDALDLGKIKSQDKVLCSGFGVGLSWGTCILQY
jgi:3-oxoacyl-[acyl-carrier-protein] synthase III